MGGPLQSWEPNVLLIAGGIGITPMLNTLRFLLQSGAGSEPVKTVHLVWSARSQEIFDAFAPSFGLDALNNLHCKVQLSLHCSSAEEGSSSTLGPVQNRRPNIGEIIESKISGGESISIRVCGPAPMVSSCEEAVAKIRAPQKRLVEYEPFSF